MCQSGGGGPGDRWGVLKLRARAEWELENWT